MYSDKFLNLQMEQIPRTTQPFSFGLAKVLSCSVERIGKKFDTSKIETFKKHNFGNTSSLLKVEVNRWLIESLVAKWDVTDQFFE